MCKHVRKSPPEVELPGLGSWQTGRGGPTRCLFLLQGPEWAGAEEWDPPPVSSWGYQRSTPPEAALVSTDPQMSVSVSAGIDSILYIQGHVLSAHSHFECIPSTPTSQLSTLFLMCFPSSCSAMVINSNTPSLKCQSKLHRDLRRTIVCIYA